MPRREPHPKHKRKYDAKKLHRKPPSAKADEPCRCERSVSEHVVRTSKNDQNWQKYPREAEGYK